MTASTFAFDKAEDSPGFLLWQTTISWQREIKQALAPFDITHAQFVILALLLWCEEQKQTPIQSFLVTKSKLDKMTVSQTLKKLSALGLVKRQEHSNDTRAKCISLTKNGRVLIKELVPIVESIDEQFFSALAVKDRKILVGLLNAIIF